MHWWIWCYEGKGKQCLLQTYEFMNKWLATQVYFIRWIDEVQWELLRVEGETRPWRSMKNVPLIGSADVFAGCVLYACESYLVERDKSGNNGNSKLRWWIGYGVSHFHVIHATATKQVLTSVWQWKQSGQMTWLLRDLNRIYIASMLSHIVQESQNELCNNQ